MANTFQFTDSEVDALKEALAQSPGVPMEMGNAYQSALDKLGLDA